eukprot:TRINITY_DN33129_c1_g1_i1.p1 TRINITY_DN33129_c1_g1~~TRINITY_DN33129_c1_g1_i1.p1  ORF type:complete len:119 (+),score=10.05 TRINITY_DN33129_c1_g1_i1:43-357(+)
MYYRVSSEKCFLLHTPRTRTHSYTHTYTHTHTHTGNSTSMYYRVSSEKCFCRTLQAHVHVHTHTHTKSNRKTNHHKNEQTENRDILEPFCLGAAFYLDCDNGDA